MGRKRILAIGDPELTIRRMVINHQLDPVDRMLAMVKETISYPDAATLNADPGFLKNLLDDGWAPYIDQQTGQKRLRMAKRLQVDILKAVAPYLYPALRAVESKEQKDWNINVSINYGGSKAPKTMEVQSTVVPEVENENENHENKKSIMDGRIIDAEISLPDKKS